MFLRAINLGLLRILPISRSAPLIPSLRLSHATPTPHSLFPPPLSHFPIFPPSPFRPHLPIPLTGLLLFLRDPSRLMQKGFPSQDIQEQLLFVTAYVLHPGLLWSSMIAFPMDENEQRDNYLRGRTFYTLILFRLLFIWHLLQRIYYTKKSARSCCGWVTGLTTAAQPRRRLALTYKYQV